MGYSHYWRQKASLTDARWKQLRQDVGMILAQAKAEGILLVNGWGNEGTEPTWASDEEGAYLSFNGAEDDRCESMVVTQFRPDKADWQEEKDHGFQFCKTGQKPYDVAVVAVLIYLGKELPLAFDPPSSDGWRDEWQAGLELIGRALPHGGWEIPGPIEERPKDVA